MLSPQLPSYYRCYGYWRSFPDLIETVPALNLVDNVIFLAFAVTYSDLFLARLMVFGLAVGFTELAADAGWGTSGN